MRFILFILMVFISCANLQVQAQEVLFKCDFNGNGTFQEQWEGAGGTTFENSRARGSIVDGGVNNSKCLKLDISSSVIASFSAYVNSDPVTIVYWERFDKYPIADANIKGVRPYYGPNGGDYMAATMSQHFNDKFYISTWREAKVFTGANVTAIQKDENYCENIGVDTYRCDNGRVRINWEPGFKTNWTKVRLYINLPSSPETNDGEIKAWLNEELTLTVTEILGKADIGQNTTSILFAPSDAASESYNHFYDEVTIYQGYVPPEPVGENEPPTISINNSISLSGVAGDDKGVSRVMYENITTAQSGTAIGNSNWSIPGLELAEGQNEIAVTVFDEEGLSTTENISITYTNN